MAPVLSVIVAVYNVEQFVSATLKSFDRQTVEQSLIEYVFVDDGSTDRSLDLITTWAKKRGNVRILQQENQGAGAARKSALEVVSGDWVTVVDPDDIIDRRYFSSILQFIDRDVDQVADMLVTKVLVLNGTTGRAYDTHPLRHRFKRGTRLVSLREEPTCIQLGATAVLRVSRLRQHQLTYDTRIEPTFEDAHLLGRYLSKSEDPIIGIVADAKYFYRKRADQSSLVQSSWSLESRYSTVLEHGYLGMLSSVKDNLGYVPTWAQNMVLYDLIWYFKEETKQHSKTAWISGELRDNFLRLLSEVFDLIEIPTIETFSINPIWWSMRQTILGFFKGAYSSADRIIQWGPHKSDGSNQYCVLFFGEELNVEVLVDGKRVFPANENFTVHSYFGIPMMTEWNFAVGVPGTVEIYVNSLPAKIERAVTRVDPPRLSGTSRTLVGSPSRSSIVRRRATSLARRGRLNRIYKLTGAVLRKVKHFETRLEVEALALSQRKAKVVVRASKSLVSKLSDARSEARAKEYANTLREKALSAAAREIYSDSWVIMDRPLRADDNGEHLYRYLKNERKDINAFFLLKRESPDWERLSKEGFRLVEYGSDESVLLLLNARYRMSSDAVAEVMYPISRKYFDLSSSKFIFLQHGVTKDDLSRWLNPKRLDGIVCSTVGEYESIVGKESPYTIKKEQVFLTGFPRFDRLHQLVAERSEEPDLILVMPTWRQYLRDALHKCEGPQDRGELFNTSVFGLNWLEFLRSTKLQAVANKHRKRIGFIPHPAFSSFIQYLDVPEHVEILDPAVHGFQNLLVRSAMFVTDYSSVAFDAANIDIPIVYFQFDPESMFGGGHNFRRGYFDYERDGFGPVRDDAIEVVECISAALSPERSLEQNVYRQRARDAFPFADANNSARLVDTLLGSSNVSVV